MKRSHIALILGSTLALAACGGGGGSTAATPVTTPTQTPVTPQSSSSIPQRANVQSNRGGTASGWVTAGTSVGPLYTFSTDTANTPTCGTANGCITAWPAYMSKPGDQPQGNMAPCSATNLQWCYEGKPLYTFTADSQTQSVSGTVVASGDGVPVGSGTFALAIPNATATAPPNATPPPTGGGYY